MTMDLQSLRAHREAILEIASRNRAFNVAVFGSVARGEQTAKSDVDLLVDFLPGSSLVHEFRQELFGDRTCPMNILPGDALSHRGPCSL